MKRLHPSEDLDEVFNVQEEEGPAMLSWQQDGASLRTVRWVILVYGMQLREAVCSLHLASCCLAWLS